MVTAQRLNERILVLVGLGAMLVALTLGQGVAWAVESNTAPGKEEPSINAGRLNSVPADGASESVSFRAFCTTGFVPTNFVVNFSCTCPFGRLVYSCGVNAFNNVGIFQIRDMYPDLDNRCFFRIVNRGSSDQVQGALVCGF